MPDQQGVIELRASNNKVVQLTSSTLEQWFAHIQAQQPAKKSKKQNNPRDNSALIGQFGMKDAESVIAFLKSPVGKSVLALIEKQLADQALLEQNVRNAQLASARKHLHLLLFLLLGLLYEEEANAARLNEAAQAEIDRIHHIKPPTHPENIDSLHEELSRYDQSIDSLELALDKQYKESEVLKNELVKLSEAHDDINLRYAIYDEVLSNHEKIAELRDPQSVTSLQEEIKKEIDSYARIISALEMEGRFSEAREKMHYSNALGLKVSLVDQLATVHQQRSSLFNSQGQTVDSFEHADFIVPKDKMLVLDSGNYYLFPQTHVFSQLSHEQKNQAREAFVSAKDYITSVRQHVNLKRTVELKFHDEQKERITNRSAQLQDNIYLLTTQLEKVQIARAQCEAKLNQAKTTTPKMQPTHSQTPKPSPLTHAKKLVNQEAHATVPSYMARSLAYLEALIRDTPSNNASAQARQRLIDLRRMAQSPLPDRQSSIANTNTTAPITPITPFSTQPKKH